VRRLRPAFGNVCTRGRSARSAEPAAIAFHPIHSRPRPAPTPQSSRTSWRQYSRAIARAVQQRSASRLRLRMRAITATAPSAMVRCSSWPKTFDAIGAFVEGRARKMERCCERDSDGTTSFPALVVASPKTTRRRFSRVFQQSVGSVIGQQVPSVQDHHFAARSRARVAHIRVIRGSVQCRDSRPREFNRQGISALISLQGIERRTARGGPFTQFIAWPDCGPAWFCRPTRAGKNVQQCATAIIFIGSQSSQLTCYCTTKLLESFGRAICANELIIIWGRFARRALKNSSSSCWCRVQSRSKSPVP